MADDLSSELRLLRRQVATLQERAEERRRASFGLVLAFVGLFGSMFLPWVLEHEPLVFETRRAYGGVTSWVDGWLLLGQAVEEFGQGGVLFAVAFAGILLLAVLVAVLLFRLSAGLATWVRTMGWVGVFGLGVLWLFLLSAPSASGPGLLVAVLGSWATALSAQAVLRFGPPVEIAPDTRATSLLDSPIRATPPPEA